MEIRYYLDEETGEPHIYQHGVGTWEVEDVLSDPSENLAGRQRSRVVIGRTRHGRYLKVIVVPDADRSGLFVVTAYDLKGKAMAAFRRRIKRRGH